MFAEPVLSSSLLVAILLLVILHLQLFNTYSYLMLLQVPYRSAVLRRPSIRSAKTKRQHNGKLSMHKATYGFKTVSTRYNISFTKSYLSLRSSASDEALTSSSPVSLRHVEFKSALGQDTHNDHNSPVIFLHGLLGQKRNFDTIGRSLVNQLRKSRRVLAVDLRNHGENFHDFRDDMSFASMAADIVQMLDCNGIKDAVLVGHSMGGKVAQAAALLHPKRVSGLVVLDIAPVTYTQEDGSWKAVQTIIHAMNSVDLRTLSSRLEVDAALKKNGVDDPAIRSFVLTNLNARTLKNNSAQTKSTLHWKINLPSIVNQLDVIAGFELPSENSDKLQYHGDTFIISGGASRFIRSGHMEIISNFFPNHMLTTVRGVGHWIHAEAPDDTIALLKRYLDR